MNGRIKENAKKSHLVLNKDFQIINKKQYFNFIYTFSLMINCFSMPSYMKRKTRNQND